MFVGDNPVADIDGAKRFGMKAAWIRRGREYPDGLIMPDYVVDLVTEMRDVVDVAGRSGCRGLRWVGFSLSPPYRSTEQAPALLHQGRGFTPILTFPHQGGRDSCPSS